MVYSCMLWCLIVYLSLYPLPSSGFTEYYVTPTSPSNTECPGPMPCYTLDQYAQNPSLLSNKDNVSLLFIGGFHKLAHLLTISRTKQLHLSPVHNSTSKVIIRCISLGISIVNINQLKVSNLSLYGQDPPNDRPWLTYIGQTALLQHLYIQNFELGMEGNSSFTHCLTNNSAIHMTCQTVMPNVKVCSALSKSTLLNTEIINDQACTELQLNITESTINRYTDKHYPDIKFEIGPSANLHITIENSQIYSQLALLGNEANNNISLNVHKSEMKNPFSNLGGVIRIELSDIARRCTLVVQITDSKIFDSQTSGLNLDSEIDGLFDNTIEILLQNTTLTNIKGNDGAISNTLLFFDAKRPLGTRTLMTLTIRNCLFLNNKLGVGIKVISNININFELNINDSIFLENENAINFRRKSFERSPIQTPVTPYFFASLTQVSVTHNSPHLFKTGVIRLYNIDMFTVVNCTVDNNQGTAVEAYYSAVTISGVTLFRNNTSIRGGALLLHESYLYFTVFSNISFLNNFASDVGGAIFLKPRTHIQFDWLDYPPCFHQIKSLLDRPVLNVNFKGNFAVAGGDDIYGGSLYSICKYLDIEEKFPNTIIDSMFYFQDKTLTSVTSTPTRVCLCNDEGTPQCANIDYIYRELPPRFPGEVFIVPAVVVGKDFGTVPGVVHTKMTWTNLYNVTLKDYLPVQDFRNQTKCSWLKLSIPSNLTKIEYKLLLYVNENTEETNKLTVEGDITTYTTKKELPDNLLSQQVQISLTLQDCPTGFILTNTPPYFCDCHPTLQDNGITVCTITNHTGWVYRSGTVWISASFTGNETSSFVVHQYCPYDYCKPYNTSVDLNFPEKQCSFNHSGVLCGGCHGNLSLALGTSKCLSCDNRYVSLLLVFALAGLTLVFFIKVLDITVSKGTISGLIFYANIVWASKSILFPTTETLHPVYQILTTFIAWLNLDLGIETCFINGLNAYWKTWLQFVFPLYVWTITGAIIIASHYSTTASNMFGNNSVPVLATLILLSYTKLLRTIITSLGFSLLYYQEGTSLRVVWSFDGNFPYFGAAHTILFLVALAVLLILWLPYTTVLLTLQWLRRRSYLKALRWINKWKPFFDAYFGQLKPKHYYWVGLLLLVRVILLVLFASTSAVVPRFTILAIAFTGMTLFIYTSICGLVYKSRTLSILEGSFIVNLTVLSMAKLYMAPNSPAHTPVIYISVGVVFIKFLGIVIYHTWCKIKSTYQIHKRQHKQREDTTQVRNTQAVTITTVDVPHSHIPYREPLLDSSIQENEL